MIQLSSGAPIIQRLLDSYKTSFWSTDSDRLFKKNSRDPQWLWHNRPISYKFNSWGHRSVEYDSLGQDFILTLGCSNTEGIGIASTDRWSEQLAGPLGFDVYCSGLYSVGPDIVARQSLLWSKRLRLPRAVYIQWPSVTRKTFASINRSLHKNNKYKNLRKTPLEFNIENGSRNYDGQWYGSRYIRDEGEMVVNFWQNVELADLAWRAVGVPVVHFTWELDNFKYLDFCSVPMIHIDKDFTIDDHDFARDHYQGIGHQGPTFNRRVAETLYDLTASLI